MRSDEIFWQFNRLNSLIEYLNMDVLSMSKDLAEPGLSYPVKGATPKASAGAEKRTVKINLESGLRVGRADQG